MNEERLPQIAGSLTFTTILGLVPTLTIALAVFTTFPQFGTLRATLEAYFLQSMIPKGVASTILGYLTAFSSKAARVSAIGAVPLVITASLTIRMVERSFNQVWRVKSKRPLARRMGLYLGVAVLGPFLFGVSLSLTANLYTAASGFAGRIPFVDAATVEILSILWTIGTYTLLYRVVPNRTVEWRDAAAGGLFSALAFEVIKRLFAAFILQFSSYRMIYGAVAAVPIFLVWMYLSWLITLVGAVVAATMPIVKFGRWKHVPFPGSAFTDAMKVIKALYQAKMATSSSLEEKKLPALTHLGADEIENLLDVMHQAGWVAHIKADPPIRFRRWRRIANRRGERWILIADPALLTLASVYRLFVFKGSDDALSKKVETVIEQGLQESLAEYFAKN
jgi:membrane protein